MPDNAAAEIGAFLDKFWGTEEGKVYIASMEEGVRKTWTQYMPTWPLDRQKIVNSVIKMSGMGKDVFFCPSVFVPDAPEVNRAYVKSVNSYWLDFDGNGPTDWESAAKEKGVPEPSLVVQSSVSGQQHAYWFTDRVSTPEALEAHENITRNLTAAFGSDISGWDLPQVLRIPGTYNYGWKPSKEGGVRKPWFQGEPALATLLVDVPTKYEPGTFSTLSQAEKQILSKLVIGDIPEIREVMAYGNWTPEMFQLFNATEKEAAESNEWRRSGALQKLAYYGAENSFSDEQIYAILDDADRRWEKYTDRTHNSRDKALRDCIARARSKIGYLVGDDITLSALMSSVHGTVAGSPQLVFSYSEFLSAEFHIEWHLDGLLAVGGFGLLVGQPGVGKTRLGIQMGLELAAGRERVVCWDNTTGPKKVVMLSLEMSGNALSLFMHGFNKEYDKDELILSRNFFLAPIGAELPLDRPEGQSVINSILSEFKPDILFIDSLQKSVSKPMTDEIAMKALTKFIADIRKRHNCSVYFVHHERKRSSERTGGFSPGDLSDVYGSQMLSADVDFVVGLAKNGTYVTLDEYKNRLATEQHDKHLISDGIRFVISDPEVIAGYYGSSSDGGQNGSPLGF